MMVKSHVQQPKCVLKHFHNQNNYLYYYDFEKQEITRGTAKSLNRIEGYYSPEVEQMLSDIIEAPLGEVIKEVTEYRNGDISNLHISLDHLNRLERYGNMCIYRGESFQNDTVEESKYGRALPDQAQHDLIVITALCCPSTESLFDYFFDDPVITFTVNKTEVPFVLPLTGPYDFSLFGGKQCVSLPLSSYLSVLYFEKEVAEKAFPLNEIDGNPNIVTIDDEKIIHYLNRNAFLCEKEHNRKKVIACEKAVLEDLAKVEKT